MVGRILGAFEGKVKPEYSEAVQLFLPEVRGQVDDVRIILPRPQRNTRRQISGVRQEYGRSLSLSLCE